MWNRLIKEIAGNYGKPESCEPWPFTLSEYLE
jgi:hypothetical protein